MKTKFLFLIGVLVLGTLLAACGPSTVTLQPQPPQRTITVTGTGMVTLTPDIAYITIGVHSQDASASVAMTANNTSAQAVIAAIKAAGVADKDIQTTNFSISPQQQYDKNGNITGILYMVDNSVYVTVRDLTRLGGLLDSSVNAGANTINSISFDVADKTDALSQARLAAVANAKKQADELTGATGVTLGAVQTISYYDSTVPVAVQVPRAALEASGSNVPVQSGSMQITTTVTIVYEIK
ncbi:MAG: SIMPL domain-containing protein [Anaerolineales bacterium]